MGETECFFLATTLLGEVGGGERRNEPKAEPKMSLGAESYGIIACKSFFTQSQVLLSSIVVPSIILVYVHTLPKSFSAGTKTIPNRASLHT